MISDPDDSVASTTSTPRASPLIEPVAPRKILLARRRARQELGHDAARVGDTPREVAIARRVDAIGARADDRERRGRRPERAFVRGGVDAERQPDTIVSPADASACANSRAFALPCGVAWRLPTIANAGRFSSARWPM